MPIEIAILGCGHPHLADILGVIASEPDLRLAAAWDSDPALVPGPISSAAVNDAERAISRADAVVVSAPVHERPVLCARAARAGRPILVEPPVAVTAAEARLVAREIARSRTPAVAVMFLRELPALDRLRSALRAGHLGRPANVHAGFVHGGALNGALRGLDRGARVLRRPGVGGFAELGVHLVDALAWLGEAPRLHAVSLDRAAGGGDLGGAAIGRWGGVPLSLRTSRATRDGGVELTVEGSAATAVVRDGALELRDGTGAPERWIGGPPDVGEAMRAFAAALRRQVLPRNGLAGAIRAQETIERTARTD